MAGRFPLYTDAHVQQALVDALLDRGWDVVRAIDVLPEKTLDELHFEYAASQGRILVTNDMPSEAVAIEWLRSGRSFRGLILWPQVYYQLMTTGDFLRRFDLLAAADEDPFESYPIIHIKP